MTPPRLTTTTRLRAGTSGFSYPAWRGVFYPERLPANRMLTSYAERLPTVELNNSFYRLPKEEHVLSWCSQVPESCKFAIKAPRQISNVKRRRECSEWISKLQALTALLKDQLAAVLVQLPPNMKCDVERLKTFLGEWGSAHPLAVEFRHPSWFEHEVLDALRDHGAALCLGDPEKEEAQAPFERTGEFVFMRFRGESYSEEALSQWSEKIATLGVDTYAYFKPAFRGPEFASRLLELTKTE